jgi:membrane protein
MMQTLKSWVRNALQILIGTWKRMLVADVPLLAGSLSFATILSLVPLLAVTLSVFKAFGGFAVLMKNIEPFIMQNLVEASGAHVSKFLEESVQRIQSGALGSAGAVALVFTTSRLYLNVEKAIRRVWQEQSQTRILRRLLVFWLIMFFGPLILAAALGLIGSKDLNLLSVLPHSTMALVCSFIGFSMINKYLPASHVSWGSVTISSAIAAFAVALAQTFYAKVTGEFLRYSKVYGSIASIPIFFLWILLLWWICLGGVALCATIERRKDDSGGEAS